MIIFNYFIIAQLKLNKIHVIPKLLLPLIFVKIINSLSNGQRYYAKLTNKLHYTTGSNKKKTLTINVC